jgi:hypothetical protein
MGWIRRALKTIRKWRWVMWTIGAVSGALRFAWFVFQHYTWIVAGAAMTGTVIAHFYSPQITSAAVAGLIVFTAVMMLGWQSRVSADLTTVLKTKPEPISARPIAAPSGKRSVPMDAWDYSNWDLVDNFELWQAVSLWVRRDPVIYSSILPEAYPVMIALKQAILDKRLDAQINGVSSSGAFAHLTYSNIEDIPETAQVSRKDLIAFAESKNQKPDFLFEDERIPF